MTGWIKSQPEDCQRDLARVASPGATALTQPQERLQRTLGTVTAQQKDCGKNAIVNIEIHSQYILCGYSMHT